MVSLREIIWSLYGAYKLARQDPDALQYFNISESGFFTSFTALLLAMPFFVLENSIDYRAIDTETPIISFLLLLCVAMALNWLAYLAVMGLFARYMDFSDKFSVFVIVYNWTQLAVIMVWMPLSILSTGLAGGSLTPFFSLIYLVATYIYLWYILRVTLKVSGLAALGFAFLEFVIAILMQVAFSDLLFTGPV